MPPAARGSSASPTGSRPSAARSASTVGRGTGRRSRPSCRSSLERRSCLASSPLYPRIPVSGDADAHPIVDPSRVPVKCVIVDDNSLFLEGATDLLRREGLDVVGVATNSAEAIRRVTELRPDVTLVDIDLGDEDGFELARRLNAISAASRVILVSTHAEE